MIKNLSSFPEGKINEIEGLAIALYGDDIDTDRIIPARFLKCVSFNALGKQVFEDDRKELNGSHPFDLKAHQNASILVVNSNFGCGSSREHAPQALMRWGIRAIAAESFAEIFYSNCLAIGIPCFAGDSKQIKSLQKHISENPETKWNIRLESQILTSSIGSYTLSIDQGPKELLLTGRWDATSILLSQDKNINKTMASLPYLNDFNSTDNQANR